MNFAAHLLSCVSPERERENGRETDRRESGGGLRGEGKTMCVCVCVFVCRPLLRK
jgi:hypothetical protein